LSTANIGRAAVNPALQASGLCDLIAVASRTTASAQAFAREHGIPKAHGSYEALIDDPDLEAVYIPLPNSLHLVWTQRALAAGKHVLCEKPLGLSAAECDEMAAAADEAGRVLMEAFMYRFHPRSERLIEMMREGVVGKVHNIQTAFTFRLTQPDNIRLDPGLGGGALMDVGCYCVNLARTVTGEEPVEVQAHARWTPSGVDGGLTGSLLFPGGTVAQFDCALDMERRESALICGTDGWLEIPNTFLPGTRAVPIVDVRGRGERIVHEVEGADEYRRMVDHFATCVRSDETPRYDAREAGRNLRVIEALYRSARSAGRPEVV